MLFLFKRAIRVYKLKVLRLYWCISCTTNNASIWRLWCSLSETTARRSSVVKSLSDTHTHRHQHHRPNASSGPLQCAGVCLFVVVPWRIYARSETRRDRNSWDGARNIATRFCTATYPPTTHRTPGRTHSQEHTDEIFHHLRLHRHLDQPLQDLERPSTASAGRGRCTASSLAVSRHSDRSSGDTCVETTVVNHCLLT